MAQEIVGVKIQVDGESAGKSVGSLKQQLREAQAEVAKLSDQFGATSKQAVEAAKRAAELKDRIGDAKALTDAFNPDAKFKALSASLAGVAGAFSALQGAVGLFGDKSEEVEKQLLKVQSAMALSQGLQSVGESIDSFKQLGVVIKTQVVGAFNALKAAIGSTGIGLLVIALGAIAANWDKIKSVVSGVSKEQEKLNKQTKENVDAQKKKLDSMSNQDNILKLQGKSEKEILKLKLDQTKQVIAATKEQIKQNIATLKAQVEAEARNKRILKGILDFITAPMQLVLNTVSQVAKLAGIDFNFNIADFASGLVFDPDQTRADGEAAIAEQQQALQQLENNAAGFQIQINDINKKGSDKNAANNKKVLEAEAAAQQELLKAKQANVLAAIKDEDERRKKELDFQLESEKDRINKLENVSADTKKALIAETEKRIQGEKDKIDEASRQRQLKAEEDFQKQLSGLKEQNQLADIENEDQRALKAIENSYQKQREEIDKNERLSTEQKILLKDELLDLEAAEKEKKQKEIDDKELAKKKQLEEEKRKLEAETLAATEQLQNRRDQLLVAGLNVLQAVVGENEKVANVIFAIQKAIEIGRIISSTASAIAQVQAGVAAVPAVLPPGVPNPAFPAAVAIGVKKSIALKLGAAAQIAEIAAASISKFKNGSGSAPGGAAAAGFSAAAPIAPPQPQATTTRLDQQSINQLGSATSRAYVLESDVTSKQERIKRINRAARLS